MGNIRGLFRTLRCNQTVQRPRRTRRTPGLGTGRTPKLTHTGRGAVMIAAAPRDCSRVPFLQARARATALPAHSPPSRGLVSLRRTRIAPALSRADRPMGREAREDRSTSVKRLGAKLYHSTVNELLKHPAEGSAFVGHGRLLSAECPNLRYLVPLHHIRASLIEGPFGRGRSVVSTPFGERPIPLGFATYLGSKTVRTNETAIFGK